MKKLTQHSIDKLQAISILSIATDLELKVMHGKCQCPFHNDKTPSLKFWPAINGWKCYGCEAKGTNIDLVMKSKDLSFLDACRWMAKTYGIRLDYENDNMQMPQRISDHKHKQTSQKPQQMNYLNTSLIAQFRNCDNAFCRSLHSTGILSQAQVDHAVQTYHLGTTSDDGVIFWQIDRDQQLRDGKIMFYQTDCHRNRVHAPSWVSYRLKKDRALPADWKASYCLFGLHLLAQTTKDTPIAIVESEKTAIICSELLTDLPTPGGTRSAVWLATGGIDALTVESLRPLVGYKVIVFPDTDPRGEFYRKWQSVLAKAQKDLGQPFYLSDLLERHASEAQKLRKIDIADYLIEAK